MLYKIKTLFYKKLFMYYPYLKFFIEKFIPASIQEYIVKHYKNNHASSMHTCLKEIMTENYSLDTSLPQGMNVTGFVGHVFGLSQQALAIGYSLQKNNIPMSYIDVSYLARSQSFENSEISSFIAKKNTYNCNLFSLNSDLIPYIYLSKKKDFFENRYNIHYGAWELEKYPKVWIETSKIMHEFWAMSRFVQESVQNSLSLPVFLMPYAIDFKIPDTIKRSYFNIPSSLFLFMFSYDMSSMNARKNPMAVIEAFNLAFPYEKEVGLVIKIVRNKERQSHSDIFADLKNSIKGRTNIYLIDALLSNEEMRGLINICDVYVSLHRSEGFGMGMAEAMKMGKAVIATNYSGNTDFTTHDTACMVDYQLVKVEPGEYVHYEPGQMWANPYVEHAAEYMKKLFQDSLFYKEKSLSGKSFIDAHYNHAIVGSRFASRLKEIGVIS